MGQSPPHLRGGGRFDLEEGGAGRLPQGGIRPGLDHAGSSDQGLQLILGEAQGRQLRVAAQAVASSGLALDGHAGLLKVGHIPVDRSNRYAQFPREPLRRGKAVAAQELDDVEQAVGTAHDP